MDGQKREYDRYGKAMPEIPKRKSKADIHVLEYTNSTNQKRDRGRLGVETLKPPRSFLEAYCYSHCCDGARVLGPVYSLYI